MARHFIILSDSYIERKRIALDILERGERDVEYIKSIIFKIKKICKGEAPFSTHSICTESEDWASVLQVDPYFAGVFVMQSVDEFIEKIMQNRVLKSKDVENYLLTKVSCSKSTLQKLCRQCYADYLQQTGQKLFEEYEALDYEETSENQELLEMQKELALPRESRILFAERGLEKVRSINKTLKKWREIYDLARSEKQCK